MKKRDFKDWVRLCAFLGCFLVGFSALPAYSNDICDSGINESILNRLNRNNVATHDALNQALPGPPDRDQIANSPCVSKELDKVVSGFSGATSSMIGDVGGAVNITGNVGGIVNKFFQAGFESLNEASGIMPAMLNFQTQASAILGDLLGSLGPMDAFSSELCGMMIDMIVKYIQCQVPIQLPQIGSIGASLNINLPDNCAGNAVRDGIYAASNSDAMKVLAQPITLNPNGSISAGQSGGN